MCPDYERWAGKSLLIPHLWSGSHRARSAVRCHSSRPAVGSARSEPGRVAESGWAPPQWRQRWRGKPGPAEWDRGEEGDEQWEFNLMFNRFNDCGGIFSTLLSLETNDSRRWFKEPLVASEELHFPLNARKTGKQRRGVILRIGNSWIHFVTSFIP